MSAVTTTGKTYSLELFLGKRNMATTLYIGLTNASSIATLADAYASEPNSVVGYARVPVLALPQSGSLSWTYTTNGSNYTASVTVQWMSTSAAITPISKAFLTDAASGSTGNVFSFWDLDPTEYNIPMNVTFVKPLSIYV